MLAGVGGIDHALLVVACDDGVMAQTREHLAILQLTGNPMLTVALTKADRVDEARVDEVERQVKEVLREYGFAEAKLFITAATEGRGIDALREHLLQLPEREHASQHSFRLAIDRAFTVKGAGLVVTGTALSGEVKVGDSLWLTGVNKPIPHSVRACVRCMRKISQQKLPMPGSVSRLTSRVMRKKSRLTVATGCLPMCRRSRSHG
ncbi:hypothetical protein EIMP300_12100 [Escherichia coli]|uniref:Tr-type G domain-containing protein n=1 Tax=Escherichia coli TaxID=562 RepID=A0A8S0FIW6_ECOLX|nr:hypothetical protein EIMP300_12100 [Escherichia coli]